MFSAAAADRRDGEAGGVDPQHRDVGVVVLAQQPGGDRGEVRVERRELDEGRRRQPSCAQRAAQGDERRKAPGRRGQRAEQVVLLEDEAERVVAEGGGLLLGEAGDFLVTDPDGAGGPVQDDWDEKDISIISRPASAGRLISRHPRSKLIKSPSPVIADG